MTARLVELTETGVITPATVRLARHLGFLYGEDNELVIMAIACTIAALSAGSVCFDIDHPAQLNTEAELDWPDPVEWLSVLEGSSLVSTDHSCRDRVLILDGNSVYLTRYWAQQDKIVEWMSARVSQPNTTVDESILDRVCDAAAEQQRAAAKLAAESRFCVVAGGPGTGKTTAVAQILAVLVQQRSQRLRVILSAPTGRAAARLEQAVRENLARRQLDSSAMIRVTSGTLHRILGVKPWGATDYNATRPLAADVVIVDEASMLSMNMMTLLLAAVAEPTRLILLGDPDQLASVEAGAVLADIVANANTVPVARLTKQYRFAGAIAALCDAVRNGDDNKALEIINQGDNQIEWIIPSSGLVNFFADNLESLRQDVMQQGIGMIEAGEAGDVDQALTWLNCHRLLLAHRHGPTGVSGWTQAIKTLISGGAEAAGQLWYPGLPILVTRNDETLNLFNGDSGVVVRHGTGVSLAIDDGTGSRLISPDMIESWEPLYGSTIHKAQGSQFDSVSVVLPPPGTTLLSRELFYTAVTRAKTFLRIIGTPQSIRQAIQSPAQRASGLSSRLQGLSKPT